MKLATFTHQRKTRIGLVVEQSIVDLAAAEPDLPTDMKAFLEAGEAAWGRARNVEGRASARIPLAEVTLEAPIRNPGKVLAIGLNYADHVKESGMQAPPHQIWFNKQWNAIAGPNDPFEIPAVAPNFIDYEGELCFVIGRRCRRVPAQRAAEVIFGYTCGNDVSVRDWQMRTPQFTLGKSFDTHAPIGPWIVTADELGDPHALALRTYVNGEQRQHSNTRELIFDCFAQVQELSAAFTLDPGDVIFTGTPSGVGAAMKPPRFLRAGDRVRVEIDAIGAIENEAVVGPGEVVIE
jgi:2-keto-4-pentenoate hydratase/2-oxohepta-3-ene-1,7-dioic acid hydratase in catechol pathway